MKIFIYSTQREISQIISDHLSFKGNHCIPFETSEDLSSLVKTMKEGPDLLILDYLSYNHDIFNIYSYLRGINRPIPVIFYNDPCITRSTRVAHWKSILELVMPSYPPRDYSIFDKTFTKLEELIISEEFSPYISLLQPPQPVPVTMIKDKYTLQYLRDKADDCITSFREKNKLPNNLFYLLSLLQKNKDYSLSIRQILDLYKRDEKIISEKSLKVLLSRLKSIIRADKECNFLIFQDKGRFRFIRYKY